MDWNACISKRIVKEINVDSPLIISLISSSAKKQSSQSLLPLNDETASSKITLLYDSLRELLEAVTISKGFKIYNHECYTAFLKEMLNESSLGDQYDAIRKIRNNINYYGKEISAEEAQSVLKVIESLINTITLKYLRGCQKNNDL
jgi:hypothetical protein